MSQVKNDPTLLKLGEVRVFIQRDGISPANAYDYRGCLQFGEAQQDLGASEPIYCPDPERANAWIIVGFKESPQALGSTDFTARASRFLNDEWFDLRNSGCRFNAVAKAGPCKLPHDINQASGWLLYKDMRLTSLTVYASSPIEDGNEAAELTGSLEFSTIVPLRRIGFGEKADSIILAEILDVLYNDTASCGDCGEASDGCRRQYALTAANSGSPGLSSQIVYTLNDKSTYATLDIPAFGGLSGNRMAVVGQYLVVISEAAGRHAYALFSDVNAGTPINAFITSGYVAGKSPRAIYSALASRTYIAGQGGYIYLMTNPTAAVSVLTDGSLTTQNLNDIHGAGNAVVAVGASNSVLYSANGDTFGTVTGPAVGENLTAIWCISPSLWWVGTGTGKLFYTLNAGVSWTQVVLPGAITTVNDIRFVDDTVGYIAAQAGATARILYTITSGNQWNLASNTDDRLQRVPTAERYNTIAVCGYNEVTIGGRETVGGDGILAVAN